MIASGELAVTLSADLMDQLRDESLRLDIPLEWLVAGLVCDTLDDPEFETVPLAASA